MPLVRQPRLCLALSALCLFALAGCRQEDEIAKETVEHADREKIRLRVALVERGDFVWVFRLSGPAALVNEHGKGLDEVVNSAKPEGEKVLKWTDPAGWKKDHPTPERQAGYRMDIKPKGIEIAVTRFSMNNFSMMKNMHRWEGQVGLPLTETHEILDKQIERKKVGDLEVKWINLEGVGVHTVSKAPEPVAAHAKKQLLPMPPMKEPVGGGKGGGGQIPFKYTVPEGWAKRPAGQFVVEAYTVADKISVTLTPAGGDVDSNVNRWREQVGLPKLSARELSETIKELPIAGIKNHYVDLANPKGPAPADKNRILGVIIPMGQESWFVKMTGPHDLVGKHKAEFESFMKSFKK